MYDHEKLDRIRETGRALQEGGPADPKALGDVLVDVADFLDRHNDDIGDLQAEAEARR